MKHGVVRESGQIPPHLLPQRDRFHAVEFGQIAVQQHLVPARGQPVLAALVQLYYDGLATAV